MSYQINELIIMNVLGIAGSIFLFYTLFHSFREFGCNQKKSKWMQSIAIVFYFAFAIFFSMLGNTLLNFLSILLFSPLIGYIFYNNQKSNVIYYILLCVGILLTDCIVAITYQTLIMNGTLYFNKNFYYSMLYCVVVRFFEFMTIRIMTAIIKRKTQGELSIPQFISSLLLPSFSIILLYSMLYLLQIYAGPSQMIIILLNSILLFGLNIYFSFLFETIAKNNTLKNKLALFEQQSELQYAYYEKLETQYQDSRKIIHDIRNHIQSIERLCDLKETNATHQYTADINEMLNKLGLHYYTDHKVLNIILNDKIQRMKSLGIQSEISIHEIQLSFVKDIDVTTIFANLLDNAIEACKEAEEKIIFFRADQTYDFTSIVIQNTFHTEPLRASSHNFFSTKQNHMGYGLKNVERTLKNYNSDIQYEITDTIRPKVFTVRILLSAE